VRGAVVVLAAALALAAAGCGPGDGAQLTVFAASSLRDVLPALDADATFVFAGSDTLAAQIREGARADVVLSASPSVLRRLGEDRLVGPPRVFASNALVVVTPAGRDGVGSLADLTRPGVRLVLGANGVPAGDYARQALRALGLVGALDNVVSNEQSVSGVLAKVALGEADAGVVYATDAAIAGDDVHVLTIPRSAQPRIEYAGAAVESGDVDAAAAFLDILLGDRGRSVLEQNGFLLPR
jgi:molybdate transport system substrate-binding protein